MSTVATSSSGIPAAGFMQRWEMLVEACLGGEILPFLGAGMSIGATLKGDLPARYAGGMPRTWQLTDAIIKELKATTFHPLADWVAQELARIEKQTPKSFADAAQLFIDVHPRGEQGLYEKDAPLDMRLFLGISPLMGHRYIAWLVREGLFSEAISTNYDCALEKAFEESFGMKPAFGVKVCHAISDLENYRSLAHDGQRLHHGVPTPVLRIYKINGCAQAYNTMTTKQDGFLVITDRHLQDFGKRQWAHDLFRDRFRCRKMLFSGFGAEEPQVRFTALRVIEEFTSVLSSGSHCFLHVYEPELSAAQLQIAKASVPLNAGKPNPWSAVFTGGDKSLFDEPATATGLSAAAFWRKLFESIVPRLIERRLERSLVFAWLREHDGHRPLSMAVVHDMRKKMSDGTVLSPWLKTFLAVPPGTTCPLLMQLCWRVRQIGSKGEPLPDGYYEECDRAESFPVMLLYLMHLLGLNAEDIVLQPDNVGFWLRFEVPFGTGSTIRWILVSEQRPLRMPALPEPSSRVSVCLTLRKETWLGHRSISLTGGLTVSWFQIALAELIAAVGQSPSSSSISKRFRDALHSSTFPKKTASLYAELHAH